MRKILPLLLTIVLMLTLAACGKGGEQDAGHSSLGADSEFENPFAEE